jgi:hypothetical protein
MKVALICCGRLENRYAVEWVEYYKQLGIDHIYIADNNYDDEEHFEDVLQQYIDEQFVTIYNYRNVVKVQTVAYSEIYYKISGDYDWICIFDFDEFLTFTKDKNIKEYLSRECFKGIDQILINWKSYTDNNLIYDDGRPCLERFTELLDPDRCVRNKFKRENEIVKQILRSNVKDLIIGTHITEGADIFDRTCNNSGEPIPQENKYMLYQNINYDLAYLRHYVTKTIEEYINLKVRRGGGDITKDEFNTYYGNNGLTVFFRYNKVTPEKLEFLKSKGIKYITEENK